MTNKEILNYLELITDELTDAHHLTDTDGTVDANYSVHSAQELVDELRDNLEGKFDDDMSIFSENAFEEKPIIAAEGVVEKIEEQDGTASYRFADGEGRLKGNN